MERIDQSYTIIPENFPKAYCSGQGPLEESVLNHKWVSVPIGSEHFSFHTKNINEE